MSGSLKINDRCRFCRNRNLSLILDLGTVGLAGAFLRPEEFHKERTFPLQLHCCESCYLLQTCQVVSADLLFRNYFYFSSAIGTLRQHFERYASEVSARLLVPGKSFVVEIGCNDGVLLRPFHKLGMKTLGIDPAINVISQAASDGVEVIGEFFNDTVAEKVLAEHGPADLIVANNVFAHIDDMHQIVRAIRLLLKPSGVFIFEAHYAGTLVEELQYDMIYHEHLSHYTLLTLQRFFADFEMEIFDVTPISIHGGSMRYYVRTRGARSELTTTDAVDGLLRWEVSRGFNRLDTFRHFADRVNRQRKTLVTLLRSLNDAGKRIVGYGASGRANTIIQYCGLDSSIIDYVVDDAPAKQGFYTPGSHLPIRSREVMEGDQPDYAIVFAWAFLSEIVKRCSSYLERGGKFIVPLPNVSVLSLIGSRLAELPEELRGDRL